jgi:hypothetical protein
MVFRIRSSKVSRQGEGAAPEGIEKVSSTNYEGRAISSDEKKIPYSEDVDITVATADMPKIAKSHQHDPNLPLEELDMLEEAIATGDTETIKKTEAMFAEDSPYPEVRAAVRPEDSGGPANTVRAWILGMIGVTICSGLNMFLSMRFVLKDLIWDRGH